jgi:hypothetical protein
MFDIDFVRENDKELRDAIRDEMSKISKPSEPEFEEVNFKGHHPIVFLNGVMQIEGTDYEPVMSPDGTFTGITLTTFPDANDELIVKWIDTDDKATPPVETMFFACVRGRDMKINRILFKDYKI